MSDDEWSPDEDAPSNKPTQAARGGARLGGGGGLGGDSGGSSLFGGGTASAPPLRLGGGGGGPPALSFASMGGMAPSGSSGGGSLFSSGMPSSPQPTAQQLASPQRITGPASAAAAAAAEQQSVNTTAPASSPATPAAQAVVICVPVQLFPSTTSTQFMVAGATLIHDPNVQQWTFLAYDAQKKPVILEVIGAARRTTNAKHGPLHLPPLEFTVMDDGPFATLVDKSGRQWKVQFRNRHEALRMLAFLTIALVAGRTAGESVPFAMVDIIRGSGKTMAAKYGAQLIVRATRIACGARDGVPLAMDTLDPGFVGEAASAEPGRGSAALLDGVKGSDLTDSVVLPRDMGELMQRAKVGGQRMYVLPGTSPVVTEIVNACGTASVGVHPATGIPPGAPSLLLVSLQIADSAKLKEKKKDKGEKKSSKRSVATEGVSSPNAAVSPSPSTPAVAAAVTDPSASPSSVTGLPTSFDSPAIPPSSGPLGFALPTLDQASALAPPSPSIVDDDALFAAAESAADEEDNKQRSELLRTVDELMGSLRVANDNVNAMPATQNKIIKFLLNELYENALVDVGLVPPADGTPLTAQQEAHVTALRNRVVGVVEEFASKNQLPTATTKGTARNTIEAMKGFLTLFQPFVTPGGILSLDGQLAVARRRKERTDRLLAARPAVPKVDMKAIAAREDELNRSFAKTKTKMEKDNARLQAALDAELAKTKTMTTQMISMGDKQMAAATRAAEAEESLKKAQDEIVSLRKKVEMSAVFEQGLLEMRKLLEVEAAERSKLQDSLEDLSRFQAKYKLTWLPDKSVSNCMLCREKFRMFGKSKHHCRFCGRIFCKECCSTMPLPEFGYTDRVLVCRPCCEFKGKMASEAAGVGAAVAASSSSSSSSSGGGRRAASPASPAQPGAGGDDEEDED